MRLDNSGPCPCNLIRFDRTITPACGQETGSCKRLLLQSTTWAGIFRERDCSDFLVRVTTPAGKSFEILIYFCYDLSEKRWSEFACRKAKNDGEERGNDKETPMGFRISPFGTLCATLLVSDGTFKVLECVPDENGVFTLSEGRYIVNSGSTDFFPGDLEFSRNR